MTEFSDTPVYSETMRDYRVHAGTDYTAAHGETVHACANGIVKETHTDMLRGNMIVIEHGDYEVRYCGLGETFLVHELSLIHILPRFSASAKIMSIVFHHASSQKCSYGRDSTQNARQPLS